MSLVTIMIIAVVTVGAGISQARLITPFKLDFEMGLTLRNLVLTMVAVNSLSGQLQRSML